MQVLQKILRKGFVVIMPVITNLQNIRMTGNW